MSIVASSTPDCVRQLHSRLLDLPDRGEAPAAPAAPTTDAPVVLSIGRHTGSEFHGHTTPEDASDLLDRIIDAGVLGTLDESAHLLGAPRAWTAIEDEQTAWVQAYVGTEAQGDWLWDALTAALGDADLDGMDLTVDGRSIGETIPAFIAGAIALTAPPAAAREIRWGAHRSGPLSPALASDRIRLGRVAPTHARLPAALWASLWAAASGRSIPLSDRRLPLEPWGGGKTELPALTPATEWEEQYGSRLHGWAAHTGGPQRALVIDLDRGHADGVDGLVPWDEWTDDQHDVEIPDTLRVVTPSGGVHIYLTVPRGIALPRSIAGLAPGVDIRCHGGLAVGCGSRKGNSGRYMINRRHPIAEAPRELIELLPTSGVGGETPERQRRKAEKPAGVSVRTAIGGGHSRTAQEALGQAIRTVLEAEEGTRNSTLLSAAGHALHRGAEPVAAAWALWQAADAIGLDEAEIRATLRNALGYSHPDDADEIMDAAEAYDPEEADHDAA